MVVLSTAAAGLAVAGGLDFHLGAGYHSSYVGNTPPSNFSSGVDTLKAMPLGVGGYAGVGYGFGDMKRFNIGVELAPSWSFSLNPLGASDLAFQSRTYLKFKPIKALTITAFGGFSGNIAGTPDDPASFVGSPVLGGRVTVLFLYADYAAVLPKFLSGATGIAVHKIGLGFVFFK